MTWIAHRKRERLYVAPWAGRGHLRALAARANSIGCKARRRVAQASRATPRARGTARSPLCEGQASFHSVSCPAVGAARGQLHPKHGSDHRYVSDEFSAFVRASDGTLYARSRVGKLWVQAPGANAFAEIDGPPLLIVHRPQGAHRA